MRRINLARFPAPVDNKSIPTSDVTEEKCLY
jgi:hypothetical protein